VTRELGVSLTRYRNRVRVGRALERPFEQGDPALAELAVELGFADQAHLSRTVREARRVLPNRPAPAAAREALVDLSLG